MQPVDDFWDYDGVDKGDFKDTAVDLGMVDDQQYFIPMQVQGMYMYWNKRIIQTSLVWMKQHHQLLGQN